MEPVNNEKFSVAAGALLDYLSLLHGHRGDILPRNDWIHGQYHHVMDRRAGHSILVWPAKKMTSTDAAVWFLLQLRNSKRADVGLLITEEIGIP